MEIAVNPKLLCFIVKVLSALIITSTLLSLNSFNPLAVCVRLVGLSLIIGALLGLTVTKWMTLSIILLFLGGIIIIFIYATALSSAQKFFWPKYLGLRSFILFWFILPSLTIPKKGGVREALWQIYAPSLIGLTSLIVIILFVSLVTTVKFTESFKGALKRFF